MKNRAVFHPVLLAMFPALFLFAHNMPETRFKYFLLSLIASVAGAAVLWMGLRLVMRDAAKAAILASLCVIVFFSYGRVYDWVTALAAGRYASSSFVLRHRYFLLASAVFLGLAFGYVLKTRRALNRLTLALNVMSVLLLVWPACRVARLLPDRIRARVSPPAVQSAAGGERPGRLAGRPDIYYLIFDRYANSGVLRECYGWDNSAFDNYLEERGFFVASNSAANYPGSLLSFASSLNMEYLNDLALRLGANSVDRTRVYPMIENHAIQRFLRQKGYRYYHFGNWWIPMRYNRYADVNFNPYCVTPSRFVDMLLSTTPLSPIISRAYSPGRVLAALDGVKGVIEKPGPKFVFAHILLPHEPYLFDRDGTILSQKAVEQRPPDVNYLNHLVFTTGKIRELLDAILAGSAKPPVIVLQSDEGPPPRDIPVAAKSGKNPEEIADLETRVHGRILNAYYVPGVDPALLHDSISPVNSFRLIFNHCFGASFEMLPDRYFISESRLRPFRFVEKTDVVRADREQGAFSL